MSLEEHVPPQEGTHQTKMFPIENLNLNESKETETILFYIFFMFDFSFI